MVVTKPSKMPTKKKQKSAEKLRSERVKRAKVQYSKLEKQRARMVRARMPHLGSNSEGTEFEEIPSCIPKIRECILDFEEKCKNISHGNCRSCRMASLSLTPNRNGLCVSCAKKGSPEQLKERNSLPLWTDRNGATHYHVPECLSCLTHAEKILIQRISPFVALTHIQNGTFGTTGHVCAFEQDIEGFAQSLPRLPSDTTVIKVVRKMTAEVGNNITSVDKCYLVRKDVVIAALLFLKEHHADYRKVEVELKNMDWISGSEGYLDCATIETLEEQRNEDEIATRSCGTCEEREGCEDDDCREGSAWDEEDNLENHIDINSDLGPSIDQTAGAAVGDNIAQFGYIDEGGNAPLSTEDQEINYILRSATDSSPNARKVSMIWPASKQTPVDEFGDTRIFTNAFPWLFPGGVGDVKDFAGKEGKPMLLSVVNGFHRYRFSLCCG